MQAAATKIDRQVLDRARNGDPHAHAALYRAYSPMVFTLALRMLGSQAAAEDVVQDSFVEVIRKAQEYRGDGSIGGWIKRIAINKCLSQLRSPWIARRAPIHEPAAATDQGPKGFLAESGSPAGLRPDDTARVLARQQELERALNLLSVTARSVVWLHDVEGYTHEEIGRLMGRSTSFSKSQLARAYRDLRQFLQPNESHTETEEAQPCLGVLKTV